MTTQSSPVGLLSSVARQWDAAAAGWNANTPIIRSWLRKATDAMISSAGITEGQRVLDVAAGAGDQTLDVAARVGASGTVVATDISPGILAFAAANAAEAGVRTIETCTAPAEAMPLDDTTFDAAVCRLGLMLMPAPDPALREILRVLKPGARFATLVFSTIETNPCLAIMMRIAASHTGLPPGDSYRPGSLFSLGRPGDLAEHFVRAGYAHVVTVRLSTPFILPSVRHYTDFVRESGAPVVALLATLDAPSRARAWAEIEAELDVFSAEGEWQGPNELLLASGVA